MNHYRVNYLLRGMEVPVGNYELRFWFEPQVIVNGSIISVLSFVILLLSVGLYFKKKINV